MKKPHVIYHKDGSIWAKGDMIDGESEGYWEWFRKPARNASPREAGGVGTKMRSGYFLKGVQIGEWTTYDKEGKVVKVTDFSKKRLHN